MFLIKKTHKTILHICKTYRLPDKVITQRLVQQSSFAALPGAHQCNVDIVVRPIKEVSPCNSCHCVQRHGAQTPPGDKETEVVYGNQDLKYT